jgi:coenzyme F420 hydrogenase subunit beta
LWFDESIFEVLFCAMERLGKEEMVKMIFMGVLQIWMRNGDYHEVNLKEGHAWTREGCTHCPDFAAEHADISTRGIGENNDWTRTVVRTELGRQIIMKMLEEGVIEGRPGDSDPGAIALMHKLAAKSRARWPVWANDSARVGIPVRAG